MDSYRVYIVDVVDEDLDSSMMVAGGTTGTANPIVPYDDRAN